MKLRTNESEKKVYHFIIIGFLLLILVSECSAYQESDNAKYNTPIKSNFNLSAIIDAFREYINVETKNSQMQDNVTQWIEILEDKTQNEDERSRAAHKLGESGNSRAVKPFLKIMEDTGESDQMREYATVNLGKVGSKKHTNILIQLLDEDPLRAGAAIALGDLGDKKAVEPLMNILANESQPEYMREHSVESLGKIGDERAVELLIECLEDDSQLFIKGQAAWALGEIGDKRAIGPLTKLLNDEREFTVISSAEALEKLGAPVEDILIENLHASNNVVRINSIYALRALDKQSAYDIILEIAVDKKEDEDVRRAAISALGKLGDENTIVPLVAIIEDENEKRTIRTRVPRTLMNIDEKKAVQILIKELEIEDMEIRLSILSAFRGSDDKDKENLSAAIEPIEYLILNDEKWAVRKEAVLVLAEIAGDDASDTLLLALNDEEYDVRYVAARKLTYLADEKSTEYLINSLNNETNEGTRCYITRALAHTNNSRAVPTLIELMQDKEEYIKVRRAATDGLGTIGDKTATKALMKILENQDDSPDIRKAAAVSLGKIEDSAAIDLLSEVADDKEEYPAIRQSAEQSLEMIQEVNTS